MLDMKSGEWRTIAPLGRAGRQRPDREAPLNWKPKVTTDSEISGFALSMPRTVEGTLIRIEDSIKQLKLEVAGEVLHFSLDANSRLWFDAVPATLRYFQPQDRVRIVFVESQWGRFIQTMHSVAVLCNRTDHQPAAGEFAG
jgi:hypothetical protein